jgi:hypothetical protein
VRAGHKLIIVNLLLGLVVRGIIGFTDEKLSECMESQE